MTGPSPLPTGPFPAASAASRTTQPRYPAGPERIHDRQEPGVSMIVRNVDSVRPSALSNELVDVDPQETAEWLDSLDAVFRTQGPERAQFLLDALLHRARTDGVRGP